MHSQDTAAAGLRILTVHPNEDCSRVSANSKYAAACREHGPAGLPAGLSTALLRRRTTRPLRGRRGRSPAPTVPAVDGFAFAHRLRFASPVDKRTRPPLPLPPPCQRDPPPSRLVGRAGGEPASERASARKRRGGAQLPPGGRGAQPHVGGF